MTDSFLEREIAIKLQASKGVDPDSADQAGATMYRPGMNSQQYGDFMDEEHSIIPSYTGDFEADDLLVGRKEIKPQIGFGAVNALPLYWFLGNATGGGANPTLLESVGSGERPWLKLRDKKWNGSAYKARQSLDNQLQSLTLVYNLLNTPQVVWDCAFESLSIANAVESIASIVYPGSTEQDDLYKFDSNFELLWDSDVISGVIAFSITAMFVKGNLKDYTTLFPTGFYDKNAIYTWTLTCLDAANNVDGILADYYAQDNATAWKNAQIKLYSTTDRYMQIELGKCGQHKPADGDILLGQDKLAVTVFAGQFCNLTATIPATDKVEDAHYGIGV